MSLEAPPDAPAVPRIRRLDLSFDDVPRDWMMDNPVITCHANGLHMVFPDGERFFIRSVRAFQHCVTDPILAHRVKGFIGQEAMHGREHEASFSHLESHGVDIQTWLRWYRNIAFQWIEPYSPAILRLSVTIALEHLTATLGEQGLTDGLLDHAHPTMARLLRWHAAEEIEHKSVAFDVYQAAGGGYFTRILGMVLGLSFLLFFWDSAVRHLMRQDPRIHRAKIREAKLLMNGRFDRRAQLLPAFVDYIRPRFHPDQRQNAAIAADWLHQAGLPPLEAAAS